MAELYRNGSRLVVKNGSNTVPMQQLSSTFAGSSSNEIYRSGTQLRYTDSSNNGYFLTGYNVGSISEQTGSLWHNTNNGTERIYLAVSGTKYGFIPGVEAEKSSSVIRYNDNNNFGSTTYTFNIRPSAGVDTYNINEISNFYLGQSSRVILTSCYIGISSIIQATGDDDYGITWRIYDASNTVVNSGTIVSYGSGTPVAGLEYAVSFNKTSFISGINLDSGSSNNRFEFSFRINNFDVQAYFGATYVTVPDTVTIDRLVI